MDSGNVYVLGATYGPLDVTEREDKSTKLLTKSVHQTMYLPIHGTELWKHLLLSIYQETKLSLG